MKKAYEKPVLAEEGGSAASGDCGHQDHRRRRRHRCKNKALEEAMKKTYEKPVLVKRCQAFGGNRRGRTPAAASGLRVSRRSRPYRSFDSHMAERRAVLVNHQKRNVENGHCVTTRPDCVV